MKSFVTHIPVCDNKGRFCFELISTFVYLSDFETCLEISRASMHADDTHVTITSDNLENLLENSQRELLNISEWMKINKLTRFEQIFYDAIDPMASQLSYFQS